MKLGKISPHDKHSKMRACRIALTLVEIGLIGYQEGLFGIEDKVKELPKGLLRSALELVVDGTDPKSIDDLVEPLLKRYSKQSIEYFETQLIQFGVHLLQQGCSGAEIFYKISHAFAPSGDDELTDDEISDLLV